MSTFLDRYKKNECEQVWVELLAYDQEVRKEPLYSDALAVSYETMHRIKTNIELLIPRLIPNPKALALYL